MTWLFVVAGAMVGAPMRYLVDRAVQARHATPFPWGTFAVNITGCLILGVLTGAVTSEAVADPVRHLVGTGLCGTLTTYSTFSYETMRLAESGRRFLVTANVTASVTAGLAAMFGGVALAEALWA
ncbi:MAG TPA: fluoride efflux transporter CrcB [Thermomonospora sp.]|nr:fluoride efflux transporter CrcB [Thermomonospora sp.]